MDRILRISFFIGFVGGLLLSIVLFFKDAATLFRKNKHFWETIISFLFSIGQAGLLIAGIVAIWIAFITDTEPYWFDAVILCTLQLILGTNVSTPCTR
jgi:ABC-type methionine transport system permease subunit